MANAKSAALKRLVERNLSDKKTNSYGELKRKKITRSEKKERQRRRELNKQKEQEINANKKGSSSNSARRIRPAPKSAEATEIENLKNEISKELETKSTYVKRQYRAEVPPGWEGLTPGLAPVGYDPDESDSDEDPY